MTESSAAMQNNRDMGSWEVDPGSPEVAISTAVADDEEQEIEFGHLCMRI